MGRKDQLPWTIPSFLLHLWLPQKAARKETDSFCPEIAQPFEIGPVDAGN